MPTLDAAPIEAPADEDSPYRLVVSFAVPRQLLAGDVWSDDVAPYTRHLEEVEGGRVDFFMADATQYERFAAGSTFVASHARRDAREGQMVVAVPPAAEWCGVFSNTARLNNLQHLVGTVRLYAR